MSAFTKLNKQDAFVTSYVAHKSWAVSSASFAEYGIDVLIAELSPTSSTATTYPSLSYATYVFSNDGTFDTWDPITNEYPGGRTLLPGYFDVEYNSTTGVAIRARIREVDNNNVSISSAIPNWTDITYRVGISGPGLSIRSGSVANIVQENGTYTFDIVGGSPDTPGSHYSITTPRHFEPTPIFSQSLTTQTGIFNPNSSPTTGVNSNQYRDLVYNSVEHLYYSGVYTGAVATSSYEDYSQTTLHPSSSRDLGSKAFVVTIPQDVFGNAIRPGTFAMGSDAPIQNYVSGAYINTGYFTSNTGISYNVFDNGEGVLLESGSLQKVGDIIYTHGLAIITNSASIASLEYLLSSASGGSNCVGSTYISSSYVPGGYFLQTLAGCPPQGFTVYWQSTKDIYTHNYRCRVRESDLNFSQNPSIKSGSNGDMYDFATGSYFQPYVTTVGLYNDSNELIGVGKLGQPVPKSKYTDMTFVVKFDI